MLSWPETGEGIGLIGLQASIFHFQNISLMEFLCMLVININSN